MIEMLTGFPPNWGNESDPIKIMNLIAHTNSIPDFPDEISEDCLDFLKLCLNRFPNRRLTAKKLLKHPFISPFERSVEIDREINNVLDDRYKLMI